MAVLAGVRHPAVAGTVLVDGSLEISALDLLRIVYRLLDRRIIRPSVDHLGGHRRALDGFTGCGAGAVHAPGYRAIGTIAECSHWNADRISEVNIRNTVSRTQSGYEQQSKQGEDDNKELIGSHDILLERMPGRIRSVLLSQHVLIRPGRAESRQTSAI